MRRILLALLCLGLLTGCASTTSPQATPPATSASTPTPNTIVIKNFAFTPMNVTVPPGAKITVHNEDTATHTLTATNKAFDTGDIQPGGTATVTAPTTPGTYSYLCQIHQFMQGSIVVR